MHRRRMQRQQMTMHRISEIEKLSTGRYRITLDDGLQFPLYGKELGQYGIEVDAALPKEVYLQIMLELLPARAKKKALHLLERMDRTEQQLRTKLTEGGYPPEIVEQTLEYVRSFHYIDDVRYARTYIEYRKASRSLRQMERELYQKGISKADFQEALEEMETPDEEEQIRQWMEKKRFDAKTAGRQERDRFIRFLLRRGYGMAAIQRVLRCSGETG